MHPEHSKTTCVVAQAADHVTMPQLAPLSGRSAQNSGRTLLTDEEPFSRVAHMKRRAGYLSISTLGQWVLAACMCIVCGVQPVRAGINIWTSDGPGNGGGFEAVVLALALDPTIPTTPYAATTPGGFNTT